MTIVSVLQLLTQIPRGTFISANANIGCDWILTGDITTAFVIYCIGDRSASKCLK